LGIRKNGVGGVPKLEFRNEKKNGVGGVPKLEFRNEKSLVSQSPRPLVAAFQLLFQPFLRADQQQHAFRFGAGQGIGQ